MWGKKNQHVLSFSSPWGDRHRGSHPFLGAVTQLTPNFPNHLRQDYLRLGAGSDLVFRITNSSNISTRPHKTNTMPGQISYCDGNIVGVNRGSQLPPWPKTLVRALMTDDCWPYTGDDGTLFCRFCHRKLERTARRGQG